MHRQFDTDILIAGAGPAGLAAACVLGAEGHRVSLVDPGTPDTDASDVDLRMADLRTAALLQPARDMLDGAGAWDALAVEATPLWVMRIVDASGARPVTRDFRADDISDAPFGWNVSNRAIRHGLLTRAQALPNVDLRFGRRVESLLAREAEARIGLSDGTCLTARLVLACDGKDSPVRRMAGIGARRIDYGQTAIVFAVGHHDPHHDVSTEIHRAGGPFTLVPLPDTDGEHRSSVVWMDSASEQARRMDLDDGAFTAEAQERSGDVMGPLRLVSPRNAWPIASTLADRFTARRLALAAEAAHAMPPIGAQGLNTSLADIATLRDLARTHPVGSEAMLDAYARARRAAVATRMAGIDLLNRTSIVGLAPVQALRGIGIGMLHDVAPLRRAVMRLGLGR